MYFWERITLDLPHPSPPHLHLPPQPTCCSVHRMDSQIFEPWYKFPNLTLCRIFTKCGSVQLSEIWSRLCFTFSSPLSPSSPPQAHFFPKAIKTMSRQEFLKCPYLSAHYLKVKIFHSHVYTILIWWKIKVKMAISRVFLAYVQLYIPRTTGLLYKKN